jgi:DNA fragmentation factor beta subunit
VKDFVQLQILTQRIFKKLAEGQCNISEKVKQFLSGENSEVVNRALLDYISSLDAKIQLETRQEDGDWFNGLPEKYETKEAVMKDGAKTRIRNYYQKTREYMLLEQVKYLN